METKTRTKDFFTVRRTLKSEVYRLCFNLKKKTILKNDMTPRHSKKYALINFQVKS